MQFSSIQFKNIDAQDNQGVCVLYEKKDAIL